MTPYKPEEQDAVHTLEHLRDHHGMVQVICPRCDAAGCASCEFHGIVGIEFENGDPCGPECPASDVLLSGRC